MARDDHIESRPASEARVCCTRTDEDSLVRLARVAKALSDPIRLGMLDVMTQGRGCCGVIDPVARGVPGAGDPEGICVCEFQEQFGLAQSKASYHLRVLKDAGLVTEETRGKWSFYAVDGERLADGASRAGRPSSGWTRPADADGLAVRAIALDQPFAVFSDVHGNLPGPRGDPRRHRAPRDRPDALPRRPRRLRAVPRTRSPLWCATAASPR